MNGVQIVIVIAAGIAVAGVAWTPRAEHEQAQLMRRMGAQLADAAAPAGDGPLDDEDFERQRAALGNAVVNGDIDEETARSLVADIDLRQAASHTR